MSNHDDLGSGGEDSIPAHRRRGRPQRPLKNYIEEDIVEKVEEEEPEPLAKSKARKRKKYLQIKENGDSHQEQNDVPRSSNEESVKPNGFWQNGSQRKSTPHRAAESVDECK
ncbi:unnamed protein product [Victoria cruziana]